MKKTGTLLPFFFKYPRDGLAHGRSFSKINESKSIPSIFKKDLRSTGAICSFGIKRGENCQKHTKHMLFESDFLESQVNIVLFIKYLQNRFALMLFFNERRDRFALFDLFQRSTRVI